MEGREIEGKSIDEAIENACSEFQVPREKLNIEIISEGTPGFLGMGAKKALIRASLLTIDMALDTPFARRGAEAPGRSGPDPDGPGGAGGTDSFPAPGCIPAGSHPVG